MHNKDIWLLEKAKEAGTYHPVAVIYILILAIFITLGLTI